MGWDRNGWVRKGMERDGGGMARIGWERLGEARPQLEGDVQRFGEGWNGPAWFGAPRQGLASSGVERLQRQEGGAGEVGG